MVNLVEAQKPLLHGLMKMAGIRQTAVEIVPGTVMHFWVPKETLKKPNKKEQRLPETNRQADKDKHKPSSTKPVVVLVHGFAAEGIVTWQFQVGALTKNYSVYVPDLLFFGSSTTDNPDRSPVFQAECLVAALKKLGVEKCTVVGFSYGGMVAFKMAEMYPEMVDALVVSGSILAMTESISETELTRMGVSSSSELLLPENVNGLKMLLKIATYRKLWFPERLHRDYLEVMFTNRKERSELLEGLVISNTNLIIPKFSQKIHLLWGENDNIFRMELALSMKEYEQLFLSDQSIYNRSKELGERATYEGVKKAGHLVHLERPCAYNRCLKQFLASVYAHGSQKR